MFPQCFGRSEVKHPSDPFLFDSVSRKRPHRPPLLLRWYKLWSCHRYFLRRIKVELLTLMCDSAVPARRRLIALHLTPSRDPQIASGSPISFITSNIFISLAA